MEPLFDKIIREQDDRRKTVKQNSVALTLQREKPFSFYHRDKNKEQPDAPKRDWEEYQFQANPIRW